MVFFDITATAHGRATMVDVIQRLPTNASCRSPSAAASNRGRHVTMLRAGADKISINSSALANPDLIRAVLRLGAPGKSAGIDIAGGWECRRRCWRGRGPRSARASGIWENS